VVPRGLYLSRRVCFPFHSYTMAARRWCFTVNNPSFVATELPAFSHERFVAWQLEKGNEGTPHIQGYMESLKKSTLRQVKEWLPTAHFEQARGTHAQCVAYVSKEETREEGPFSRGKPNTEDQGKRMDLDNFKEAIKSGKSKFEIMEEFTEVMAKYPRFYGEFLDAWADEKCVRLSRQLEGIFDLVGLGAQESTHKPSASPRSRAWTAPSRPSSSGRDPSSTSSRDPSTTGPSTGSMIP